MEVCSSSTSQVSVDNVLLLSSGGHRPVRVLHQRGVGHSAGAGGETRQGLRLLSGALPG